MDANRQLEERDAAGAPDAAALAGELRVLLGKLMRRLRKEASIGDLTESQISVLLHLERAGSATVSMLAKEIGVRPQSMGATVAALENAGLVKGEPDPRDGRQTVLSLTAQCVAAIQAGRSARDDWLCSVIQANLSLPEQQQLAQAVDLLKRLADS